MKSMLIEKDTTEIEHNNAKKRNRSIFEELAGEILLNKVTKEARPMDARNLHFRDARIVFDPIPHEYYLDGEKLRIGVTTLASLFVAKFDQEERLKSKFKYFQIKDGKRVIIQNPEARAVTADIGKHRREIIDQWDFARDRGSGYHDIIENFYHFLENHPISLETKPEEIKKLLLTFDPDLENPVHNPFVTQFVVADNTFRRNGWTIHRVEWRIYDEDLSLGGSIDAVFRKVDPVVGEQFMFVDWKISEKSFTAAVSWQNGSAVFFYPLSHLKNSKLNTGSMQLNLYADIARRKYKMNVTEMYLAQINPKTTNLTLMKVPRLTAEVSSVLSIWGNILAGEQDLVDWEEKKEKISKCHPAQLRPSICYGVPPSMQKARDMEKKPMYVGMTSLLESETTEKAQAKVSD